MIRHESIANTYVVYPFSQKDIDLQHDAHHHGSLSPERSCLAKTHGEGGSVFGGRTFLNNLVDCLSALNCAVSFAAGMTSD
mmetsp:Transcript_20506/g.43023  ORF Transcript_20506/g.43023 Transcript_20506/m.43023 type:complete len:81 (+) Transcript_20506:1092-1334(+)